MDVVASPRLRVLDAGCGREIKRRLFPGAYIVGIDVDEAALASNHEVDEKILGDIQSYPFAGDSFDAITCFDVLEHLRDPEGALANLARALKPGGEIHVGIPNVSSPKGIATKLTPHWFHIWFYRHVVGDLRAGTPGHGPFKTHLRWSLRPQALDRLARGAGLQLVRVEQSEGSFFAALWQRHRVSWAVVQALWRLAGLGDPRWTDCTVVMKKEAHIGGPAEKRARPRPRPDSVQQIADQGMIGLKSLQAAFSFGPGYEPQPPGTFFETGTPRGYWIDFRAKTRAASARVPERLLPADLAQLALGWWDRHLAGDPSAADRFLAMSSLLEQSAVADDGALVWPYDVAVAKLKLRPPWLSALAQGQAASVFVRAFLHTDEERFAAVARKAVTPLLPASSFGLVAVTADGPVPEEAPSDPPSLILNGWIYALWGLWDVAAGLADADTEAAFTASVDCLRRRIDKYDVGWWSLYSLYPYPLPDLAKPFYHRLHIDQLEVLYRLVGYPELATAARRWRAYDTPPRRLAVIAQKALFKSLT